MVGASAAPAPTAPTTAAPATAVTTKRRRILFMIIPPVHLGVFPSQSDIPDTKGNFHLQRLL